MSRITLRVFLPEDVLPTLEEWQAAANSRGLPMKLYQSVDFPVRFPEYRGHLPAVWDGINTGFWLSFYAAKDHADELAVYLWELGSESLPRTPKTIIADIPRKGIVAGISSDSSAGDSPESRRISEAVTLYAAYILTDEFGGRAFGYPTWDFTNGARLLADAKSLFD